MLLAPVSIWIIKIAVTFSGFWVSVLLNWMCKAFFISDWLYNSSNITPFQQINSLCDVAFTLHSQREMVVDKLSVHQHVNNPTGWRTWTFPQQLNYIIWFRVTRALLSIPHQPPPQSWAFFEDCHFLRQTFLLHLPSDSCTNKCCYRVPH